MQYYFSIFFLITVFTINIHSQSTSFLLKKEEFKGNIQSIVEIETTPYDRSENPEREPYVIQYISHYDKQKRLLTFHEAEKDSTIFSTIQYEYNGNEHQPMTTTHYIEKKWVSQTTTEEKNSRYKKNVTRYISNNRSNKIEEIHYTLNEISIITKNENNEVKHIYNYKLKNGLYYEEKWENPEATQTSVIKYILNKNGDKIEAQYTDILHGKSNSYYYIFTYEYDETGNWTKKMTYLNGADKPCSISERTITYYK